MTALVRVIKKHPHKAGLVCAVLASAIFGLYPSTLRVVYADGGNAVFMILAMSWARGLGLYLYCLGTRAPLFQTREDTKQAVIGGFFQAVSNSGVFLALLYIPGPLVITIAFSHTLMLLFYMAWRGEIKLGALNVVTAVIALFGLTLVLDVWHVQPIANWIGMALAFMTALATVTRLYVYGKQTQKRNPIAVGAENLLLAAFFVLPLALFQAPHMANSMTGNMYALVSCASFSLASFFMFWGIGLLGSFQYSLMCKIEPIFTSIFSVLVLNEILGVGQYLGIALTVGSLIVYQVLSKAKGNQSCAD